MWRKSIILLFMTGASVTFAYAQKIAFKNNILMDAMALPNLALEFKTGARTTLEIPASVNLWSFSDEKKFKHIAVQPEFRWWMCQAFTGHFFGLHAHYAYYNAGGIGPFTAIRNNRYEGWLAGAGISYGYSWIFSPRWSLEATIGAGYAYMSYDKYPCGKCQPLSHHNNKHYFGPTKAALTLVFNLK